MTRVFVINSTNTERKTVKAKFRLFIVTLIINFAYCRVQSLEQSRVLLKKIGRCTCRRQLHNKLINSSCTTRVLGQDRLRISSKSDI